MDAQLRSLERAARSGDPEAQKRLETAERRAGIVTSFVPKKLVGPNGILTKGVGAWHQKVLSRRSDIPHFLRFVLAIAERHGPEFASYCLTWWLHEGGNIPELINSIRSGIDAKDRHSMRLAKMIKEALGK